MQCNVCTACARYMHGVCIACAWHVHGMCTARAWRVHGMCMACAWRGQVVLSLRLTEAEVEKVVLDPKE